MAEAAVTEATEVKAPRKARGRPPVAKKAKPVVSKPVARKPRAKAAAARKPAAASKPVRIEQVSETVKEVAYAQLGLCGLAFDTVNERVAQARKDMPQWRQLVKRGVQVQRDLDSASKDLRKRVGKLSTKTVLQTRLDSVRDVVAKLRARVRKAA